MFTRELRVMPSDASLTGRIKLFNLLNYFQDTAELAVEKIEGSSVELYSRGYAWILSKYEIDFHADLPTITQKFSVSTFHDPHHGYNTLRMFHLHSDDGSKILSAKTSWLLVDVRSGRPVKPLAHIPGIDSGDCGDIDPSFSEIPDVTETLHTENITVRYHDTDYNGHVNNAIYFRWLCDYSGNESNFRRICASFRSGAKLGENITLRFGEGLCAVIREGNAKPCAKFLTEAMTN